MHPTTGLGGQPNRFAFWSTFAVLLLTPWVHGQTPGTAVDAAAQAAERQQREEQDRQRAQLQRERASVAPVPVRSGDLPLPTVSAPAMARREVKKLRILGADHMRPAFRKQLLLDFEGRSIGVEDLERLLTEITRHYVTRGYVTTRVYVPDQDLSTGELRVLVVEGKIERVDRGAVTANVFPGTSGELLNLRELEQGIDNLNRLPSHQAALDLLPGAEAGATIIGIRDQRTRPWRVGFSADNTGSESTGREQASLSLGVDDLIGIGDGMNLSHRRSVPYRSGKQASEATMGSVSVPWGYQTFTVGGSMSSYAMLFAAPSGLDLPFDGQSWSLYLRADRMLYRGQTARFTGYANLTWKASRNYLMGSKIGVSSRDAVVLDLGANFSTVLAGGFVSLDASVSRGLPIFGALEDPAGLPGFAAHAEFTTVKLNASWSRSFSLKGLPLSFSSALNAQVGPDVLYGSDQLTVGGLYAVRGFDQTNLAGDVGYVWRNDLSATFAMAKGQDGRTRLSLRPYVGLDHGYAWSNVSGLPGFTAQEGSLVGGALGCAITFGRYTADAFYAQSLDRAAGMPSESGRAYFRFNGSF